jgi:hypothetical protein
MSGERIANLGKMSECPALKKGCAVALSLFKMEIPWPEYFITNRFLNEF